MSLTVEVYINLGYLKDQVCKTTGKNGSCWLSVNGVTVFVSAWPLPGELSGDDCHRKKKHIPATTNSATSKGVSQ